MAQGGCSPEAKYPPELILKDDDPSKGYYTIVLTIPKMKVKSSRKGLKKIDDVENGEQCIHIKEEDISVYVKVEHEGKTTEYSYIKKLPEDVMTSKSEFKLKKEEIRLILRKKENKSWGQYADHFTKRS